MSRRVDPTSQGKLQGAINSVRAITGMIGPLLFTQVLALAISPSTPIHFPGSPYFLAGLLLTSSLVLAAYVTRADIAPWAQPSGATAISHDPSD
jgi:DHA1 family tetracycline resistance protein-like MFS transporter